jgi:hypothetical protein
MPCCAFSPAWVLPGGAGPSGPALRYWKGDGPEWDLVAASVEGDALLLAEAKWSDRPFTETMIEEAARALLAKGTPRERWAHGKRVVHALFVPRLARMKRKPSVGTSQMFLPPTRFWLPCAEDRGISHAGRAENGLSDRLYFTISLISPRIAWPWHAIW